MTDSTSSDNAASARQYLLDMNKTTLYDLSNSDDHHNSAISSSGDKSTKNRQIFVARHGERVDFTFGQWIPYCFDGTGKYTRKDLNMPKYLPKRVNSPDAWLLDSPLTNIGICQAKLTGDAMKDAGIEISHVYCSPSYRCVQTCNGILEGLGLTSLKIRLEFALYEWMTWYQENMPAWCTKEELLADNFNIDMDYVSMITKEELQESTKENCEQFYKRNHMVVENALKNHPTGNVLLVGHAVTLESCSRLIIGRKARTQVEVTRLLQKIPYCSMVTIEQSADSKWSLVEPPCYPVTHNKNARFEWKSIDD